MPMNYGQTQWVAAHADNQKLLAPVKFETGDRLVRLEMDLPKSWEKADERAAIRELQAQVEKVLDEWRARSSVYLERTTVLSLKDVEASKPGYLKQLGVGTSLIQARSSLPPT